jgi:hypothetical protein
MKKYIVSLLLTLLLVSPIHAYTVIKGDTPYGLWGANWQTELAKYGISDPRKLPVGLVVNEENEELGGTLPVAGQTYTLAGSGITASASSITLTSLTIPQTGYELQDSDFSSTFYVTVEPGNTKRQEIASCTTVTQNANNTATLSGCSRGLLPFSPYTTSSSYQFAHAGGTSLIFSDAPQLFNEYPAKGNTETITGQWNFNTYLPYVPTSTPTDDRQVVSLYQFQQATTTGGINASETAKGVGELAIGAETAAGTSLGATGARLIIPNSLVSSTSPGTYGLPSLGSTGKIDSSFGGSANSVATLDSSSLVVQNPVNATSTPTANKIPISNASGTLPNTWLNASTTATAANMPIAGVSSTISVGFIPTIASSTAAVSYTTSTAGVWNSTFDCGFAPTMLQLNFDIDGSSNGSAYTSIGQAYYSGTSIRHVQYFVANQLTSATGFGSLGGFGASGPTVGGATGNYSVSTLSIASVTGSTEVVANTNTRNSDGTGYVFSFGLVCYR